MIKKRRCFQKEVVEPCVECGTERVGFDCNDGYHILPGQLFPSKPTKCSFVYYEEESGQYYPIPWAIPSEDKWFSRVNELADCPSCGAKLDYRIETVYPLRIARVDKKRWYCPNGPGMLEQYRELPGCPACRETYSRSERRTTCE